MKLAIMQPYFFPYIGYFQLINAVDKFVFYDDVNFIKLGWINRNRILVNGEIRYFTISLNGASQNKQINEIERIDNRAKLKKTILNAYCKAPNFNIAWPLIELCIDYNSDLISEIAANSVVQTSKYLGLTAEFEFSSKMYQKTINLTKAERLIEIAMDSKI